MNNIQPRRLLAAAAKSKVSWDNVTAEDRNHKLG